MSSSINPSMPPIKLPFTPDTNGQESPATQALVAALGLTKHIEGGYFAEIDRNPLLIPNPFTSTNTSANESYDHLTADATAPAPRSGDDAARNASTSIYYLLTRASPMGCFHRNRGRTVHTLVRGRGVYVLIHADEPAGVDGRKRVEAFVVGSDVARGERCVWVVEGGKYKASFLLDGDGGEGGLLVSETVIPGFEYSDHDFLTEDRFKELVTEEQAKELEWLLRRGAKPEAKDLL